MKTSTIEVGELISTLSAAGVERQLTALPGMQHVNVNYVAGSATVHFDETQLTLAAIRQRVADCGYHCRGEQVPAHVCNPADHKPPALLTPVTKRTRDMLDTAAKQTQVPLRETRRSHLPRKMLTPDTAAQPRSRRPT